MWVVAQYVARGLAPAAAAVTLRGPWDLRARPAEHHRVQAQPRAASWETLEAYARDQVGEVAAGRGPTRAPPIDERYRRYFAWARTRETSGAQYLVATAQWRPAEHCGPWVALEPNIVAYELEPGIEHWNLWYHPNTTPGSADLDLLAGAEVEVLPDPADAASRRPGRIVKVRRLRWEAPEAYEVLMLDEARSPQDAALEPEVMLVGRERLAAPVSLGRWAAVLRHARVFLPTLREDEAVIFQNVPQFRSVPEVAHAHVFVRPRCEETRSALRQLRREWRDRSPWGEHERSGGRGDEVGYAAPAAA